MTVMMKDHVIAENLRPVDVLDALMARHGVVRVMLALPFAAWRWRAKRPVNLHALSGHLRRDIGLDSDVPRAKSWELG